MKLKNIGYVAFIAATAAAFVIGSGGASQAKAKKKVEAARPPVVCFQPEARVCAVKGGMKFTYANSCYAVKDGAKVVSQKACPVAKGAKPANKSSKKKMAKPAK
jgi:hypothetical protein